MTHIQHNMTGRVILIGAGCGPDLITVAGSRALAQAEVVIYDSLLDAGLLTLAPQEAERIYVGKRAGAHSMRQEEITAVILDRALAGRLVVRLHGGDSLVFGRGGEEILALQEAGIPYEVIPGVSSAIAVPEHCGIPVTHRQAARSFTVVTGHTADGTSENYQALAALQGTLVFLMGIHAIPEITARLMAEGKDPATPAAVLSQGYTPQERRYNGTLATIADVAADAATPGILVVGPTADYHMESVSDMGSGRALAATGPGQIPIDAMQAAWPLAGVRVTVTGTESMTGRLRSQLEPLGASVTRLPCLSIVPHPERVPQTYEVYHWLVFTSSNGVRVFMDALRAHGVDLRTLMHVRFAVIGSGTAQTLRGSGFAADYMPADYTAEALGKGLASVVGANERVAVLRAAEGSQDLNVALEQTGIDYDDIAIYETAATSGVRTMADAPADYLVFVSAAGVRAYLDSGYSLDHGRNLVVIGEATAAELRRHTDRAILTAAEHTAAGIADVILRDCTAR